MTSGSGDEADVSVVEAGSMNEVSSAELPEPELLSCEMPSADPVEEVAVEAADCSDDEVMVVKLSWPLVKKKPSEVYFLQRAKEANIKGVPELVEWQDAMIDGQIDSTNNIRGAYRNFPDRVNRRLLMRRCGVNIWFFATRDELLLAFDNIVDSKPFVLIF